MKGGHWGKIRTVGGGGKVDRDANGGGGDQYRLTSNIGEHYRKNVYDFEYETNDIVSEAPEMSAKNNWGT